MDKYELLECRSTWLSFILVLVSSVSSMGPLKPMRIEYAISRLTQRQKEQFVDEHNRFRSLANPPAANMEYMFWNDDVANLAQMWANKCIWDHGFLEFGDMTNAPFKGQVGQNLAREWSRLRNPADCVRLWYQKSSNYTFSKLSTESPGVPNHCSKPPCRKYTQIVWATTRYVGCGISFCDKSIIGASHPWVRGETEVVCDYAPGGNLIDRFPYKFGKPCSKCASSKGFCYKNLCRDCDDFDPECGKSLTLAMCTAFEDVMAKKCPKMCNLCECPLECQNGGKLNTRMCTCACPPSWKGLDCSDEVKRCPLGFFGENSQFHCVDKVGTEVCHWRISNGHQCKAPYMQQDCAASCRVCGGPSGPTTKPSLLVTTPKPQMIHTAVPQANHVKPPETKLTTPGKASTVKISSKATSTKPAMAASVVLSNKPTDVMLSIGSVTPSNLTTTEVPRVISNKPSSVLPVTQSLNPMNVTPDQLQEAKKYVSVSEASIEDTLPTHCRDENPKCRLWSALGKCKKKSKWMKNHCFATCKQVIDEYIRAECKDSTPKCPFWALAGECARDRLWMLGKCKKSCNQCGECKDSTPKCPFWALAGECARDRLWMLGKCKKSCNQCGVCKDDDPKCAELALARQCMEGDIRYWMLTNCRQSCGLCQVYDKHDYCPAWAAGGECKKSNWTWMRDNCPLSCGIPLTEVLFCGKMKDGKYPISRICTGFVSCSGGVTRHEMCPNGRLFHPIKRICDLPHNVKCSYEEDLILKRSHVARGL